MISYLEYPSTPDAPDAMPFSAQFVEPVEPVAPDERARAGIRAGYFASRCRRISHGIAFAACMLAAAALYVGMVHSEPAGGLPLTPHFSSQVERGIETVAVPDPPQAMVIAAREIEQVWDIPYEDALAMVQSAVDASAEQRVDPLLTLAIMAVESGFDSDAVSPAGARGPMQLVERWHLKRIADLGARAGALTPDQNIQVGVGVLREYLNIERGNLAAALQRYNGSLDDETRRYSEKVLKTYKQFRVKFSALAAKPAKAAPKTQPGSRVAAAQT